MKITMELNGSELLHTIKSGTLAAMVEDLGQVEKEVTNVVMTPKQEDKPEIKKDAPKVDKPKTEKPKKEDKPQTPDPDPEEQETEDQGSDNNVSIEEVRAKLAELMKKGKKAEVADLLSGFDAQKLTDVEESDYAALLEKANKI